MVLFERKEDCCGCTACMAACPKQAIQMQEDEQGFQYPTVNGTLCVSCGLCRAVCPVRNADAERGASPKVYAAKHRDPEVRKSSSSGGVFSALAERTLALGGAVAGVVFDENWNVRHMVSETETDCRRMRGSKYVQSDMGKTFSEAGEVLKAGRKLLFTGTPCQVIGFKRYAEQRGLPTDKLLLCTLVCQGVPSPKIWRDYLSHIKSTKSISIEYLSFRNKDCGWDFNKEVARGNGLETSLSEFVNLWDNLIKRPCCYQCKYATAYRDADISLADFYGIQRAYPEFYDSFGVSLVLAHTEKGERWVDSLSDELDVISAALTSAETHPRLYAPAWRNDAEAQAFWSDYSRRGLPPILLKYTSTKLPYRVWRKLRLLKRKIKGESNS